jgi:hypothetical protein
MTSGYKGSIGHKRPPRCHEADHRSQTPGAVTDSRKSVDSFVSPGRQGGSRERAKRASGLPRVTTGLLSLPCRRPPSVRDAVYAFAAIRPKPISAFRRSKPDLVSCLATCSEGHNRTHARSTGFIKDAPARGRTILNSVNSSGCVSTSIEPPCCLTMMS